MYEKERNRRSSIVNLNVLCYCENLWCEKFARNFRQGKMPLLKHQFIDSSANIQLSKRLRWFHNWIFTFVKHQRRWVAISLTQQKINKYYSGNSTNFSRNLFAVDKKRNERQKERHTNEICFYTYDHLLDIFLNIRVSRNWTNTTNEKNRVMQ